MSPFQRPNDKAFPIWRAGAIGSTRISHSHRTVTLNDRTDAVEMIFLASHAAHRRRSPVTSGAMPPTCSPALLHRDGRTCPAGPRDRRRHPLSWPASTSACGESMREKWFLTPPFMPDTFLWSIPGEVEASVKAPATSNLSPMPNRHPAAARSPVPSRSGPRSPITRSRLALAVLRPALGPAGQGAALHPARARPGPEPAGRGSRP